MYEHFTTDASVLVVLSVLFFISGFLQTHVSAVTSGGHREDILERVYFMTF